MPCILSYLYVVRIPACTYSQKKTGIEVVAQLNIFIVWSLSKPLRLRRWILRANHNCERELKLVLVVVQAVVAKKLVELHMFR